MNIFSNLAQPACMSSGCFTILLRSYFLSYQLSIYQKQRIKQKLVILFTEQCVGLPPDITGLTTTQTFPVLSGTRVSVTCSDTCSKTGTCTNTLTLRGDEVITCSDVMEYLYSDRPKCNQLGMHCLYVYLYIGKLIDL